MEEVEESDSDEDTILAYKELYQLNTAVTKYTSTTTTTTTTHQQNICQNIAGVEGNNDYRVLGSILNPPRHSHFNRFHQQNMEKDISA